MTVPGSVPPHANFGKPLSAQQEVALPTCTRQSFRELIVEGDLELHVAIRRNRLRQMHLDHSSVVFVCVIQLNELKLRRQIALSHHLETLDVLRPVVLAVPLFERNVSSAVSFGLLDPCGSWLKGVEIKVERKCV